MANAEILLDSIQNVDEITGRIEKFHDASLPAVVKDLFEGSLIGIALNIMGIADDSDYIKNFNPEKIKLIGDYMERANLPGLEASLIGYAQQNRYSSHTMENQKLVDIEKATPAEAIIAAYLLSEELVEGSEALI